MTMGHRCTLKEKEEQEVAPLYLEIPDSETVTFLRQCGTGPGRQRDQWKILDSPETDSHASGPLVFRTVERRWSFQ